jgi:coenzyme F420 hydrogenase subunit beta
MLCAQSCPAAPAHLACKNDGHTIDISDEYLIGPCLGAYVGYSTDERIRYRAASGGVVTSLLLKSLESGTIDSALTIESNENNPFEPHALVARNRQKIIGSMGSVYLPVELSAALKQIIRDNSIKRIGIVGLPCHIDGIKKASLLLPDLRGKIAFTIGLFCKQMKDLRFTQLILSKMGIKEENVREIKFRGEGWPGNIQIRTKDEKIFRTPYLNLSPLWGALSCSPIYCLMCQSPMAESADISVGDPWLDEYKNDKLGDSLFVIRTEIGTKIVDRAVRDGQIYAETIAPSKILDAQSRFAVSVKKANFESRLQVLGLFKHNVPDLYIKQSRFKVLRKYPEALWTFGTRSITSSFLFRKIFPFLPDFILRGLSRGFVGMSKVFFKLGK